MSKRTLHITTELVPIFEFLIHISDEVEYAVVWKDNFIEKLYTWFKDLLDTVGVLWKDNREFENAAKHINMQNFWEITELVLKTKPSNDRVNMQIIFAYLETIKTLWNAYNHETDNYKRLIELSTDKYPEFIKNFLLTEQNNFFKQNKAKFDWISPRAFIDLRNALAHFFSVGTWWLQLGPSDSDILQKVKKYTNDQLSINPPFLDSEDFFHLVKAWGILLIEKWESDSKNNIFWWIEYVKNIVNTYWAKLIREDQFNI